MTKPLITKVKESPWWACNGALGDSPAHAYRAWLSTGQPVKSTTKVCPECGSASIARFSSFNRKYCTECYSWLTWELEPGQEPLIGPARRVRKV